MAAGPEHAHCACASGFVHLDLQGTRTQPSTVRPEARVVLVAQRLSEKAHGPGKGPAASGCWHRLESRVLFAEAGSPRSQIWIQERLRVSKVKEGCKEMSCAAFIRELIWKEIECEPAARLSAPGPRGREAQPAPPGLAKAKAQPGAAS